MRARPSKSSWVLVGLVALGCDKPVAAKRDPEPSSSVGVSAKKLAGEVRCRTGTLVGKNDPPPKTTSPGGWGDGVGLGSIGGFGGGEQRARTTTVDGYALPSKDFHVDDINRQACAQLRAMSICIEESRPAGLPALKGELDAELSFDAGAVTKATVVPGGLDDAPIHKCVTDALSRMRFIGGSGTVRYHLAIDARRAALVKLIETSVESKGESKGKLPIEVIKRIVRANFPRLRACYESALKKDPAQSGVVATGFRIDADGTVQGATVDAAKTTVTDEAMKACVASIFASLAFPEPEGGTVDVSYPINFTNE